MGVLFYLQCSSAIYANRFYLSLFGQRNQGRLALNSEGHPTILGWLLLIFEVVSMAASLLLMVLLK